MKKIILFALVIVMGANVNQIFAQKKTTKVICFKSNMDCSACEETLNEHLRFEKGIKDLIVDHASNTIFIEYREDKNTDEKIAESIVKKGYKAEKISPEEYKEIINHVETEGHVHEAEVHTERN